MTSLLIAIIGVIVVALCLRAGFLYVRLYNLRYEMYREHALVFYDAAERLVDNPNTPNDVLSFVNEMNGTINFPNAAFVFSLILWKKRKTRKIKAKKSPRFDLRALPDDVVADFVIAFEHWIDAMAYRGMGWGTIFKALLDAPTVEEKAKSVARKAHKIELATVAH
ncbi:hypothetical protein IB024_01665 [Brucella sp. 6810]|uniref:hypothetical protein n=1 Tax=Brucella sp. 6810 TaxID=2769351 RepID=UPI00165AC1E0|nr:hypothetical protein [Brucella sp. 6810]QNQ62491.1 hypothetical protein IB024_01665 [Brucella sp. 6810]